MTARFDMFVILAEMRTGSNFLESNLNTVPGLACHGEAFNPQFIAYPNRDSLLGISASERDVNPGRLLAAIRADSNGLGGFRYFHDHDPRVLPHILDDPRCAKIVLTRNPLDSYVSWKIAQATGQWKLTNVTRRKDSRISFDGAEFAAILTAHQAFQVQVLRRLQVTGQTAFYIGYDDLHDLEVLNGLLRWLGLPDRIADLSKTLKRQNPEPLRDRVDNPEEMEQAAARLDLFNLNRTPNFEPRRGPAVPGHLAARDTPLLFLPIPAGPTGPVEAWLAALDGVATDDLRRGFSQRSLRDWMDRHPGHRSFAVVRHPLARAHTAFCRHILPVDGPDALPRVRRVLGRRHNVDLPPDWPDRGYDRSAHRAAFVGFLRFVRANLSGQTVLRTEACWASQSAILAGMAEVIQPDVIVREEDVARDLPDLARRVGHPAPPLPEPDPADQPFALSEICDDALQALARDVYARDYVRFGFRDLA